MSCTSFYVKFHIVHITFHNHVTVNRIHFTSFQSLQYIIISHFIDSLQLCPRTCLIIRLNILPFYAGRLYKQAYHICSNIIPYTMTHDTFLLRFIISYYSVHFLHRVLYVYSNLIFPFTFYKFRKKSNFLKSILQSYFLIFFFCSIHSFFFIYYRSRIYNFRNIIVYKSEK